MSYGRESNRRLAEAHPDLQRLFREVERRLDRGDLAPYVLDSSVLCAFRGEAEQNEAYNARPQRSKLPWPRSKHNVRPA